MRISIHFFRRAPNRRAVVILGSLLCGCGGPVVFSGKSALSVIGAPPPAPSVEEPKARVELRDDKIVIHEKIQFDFDKATIKDASFGLLNEVANVIRKNQQIRRIAIEGHASAEGSAEHNLSLSDSRAKAVMGYLVSRGIPKEMFSATGFGESRPLAENDTEEGREKNRRVEFNIVEQDVTQKKVEIDPRTGNERVIE